MNLSQQVCSLPLAKRLEELGVKQESLFYWGISKFDADTPEITLWKSQQDFENTGAPPLGIWSYSDVEIGAYKEVFAAFTVAELGEMLPKVIKERLTETFGSNLQYAYNIHRSPIVEYRGVYDNVRKVKIPTVYADTEADARAKMLIYLLESMLVTV